MADKGWQREFEDPISLITLRDAADYITSLPKKESDLPEWQTAIGVLMLVARSGPTTLARIAVMKVLNGGLTAISDWLPRFFNCENIIITQPLLLVDNAKQ